MLVGSPWEIGLTEVGSPWEISSIGGRVGSSWEILFCVVDGTTLEALGGQRETECGDRRDQNLNFVLSLFGFLEKFSATKILI